MILLLDFLSEDKCRFKLFIVRPYITHLINIKKIQVYNEMLFTFLCSFLGKSLLLFNLSLKQIAKRKCYIFV